MGIDNEREKWEEEAGTTELEEAPAEPCSACSRPMTEEDKNQIKSILFNTAFKSLSAEEGKVVLITDDGCQPCEEAQQILEPFISKGAIEVMAYKKCSPEDRECIARRGIATVPVLVARGPSGEFGKLFPLSAQSLAVKLTKED